MNLILKKIFLFIQKYPDKKKHVIIPLLFMFLSSIISFSIPVFIMIILDKLKSQNEFNSHNIIPLIVIWFFAIVLYTVFDYLSKIYLLKYNNLVLEQLFPKYLSEIYIKFTTSFEHKNSKELADEIKTDIQEISSLLPLRFFSFLRDVCVSFFALMILLYISWQLVLAISLILPLFFLYYILWKNDIYKLHSNVRISSEQFLSNLIEFFQTFRVIFVFNTLSNEIERIKSWLIKWTEINLKFNTIGYKLDSYSKMISLFAPIYLAFIALLFLINSLITIGGLFAFWGIFSLFLQSLNTISAYYIDIKKAIIVVDKITPSHYQHKKKIKGILINNISKITTTTINITFNNNRERSITYPKIILNSGEFVQFAGASGVGKTTLLKTLLGIKEIESGKIFINNIDIEKIDKQSYLNLIGYVEQNGYIYSRSISENIILGRQYNKKQFERVISITGLHSLTNNQNELLGENGLEISGGERQRILIARAIYHNPSWLFLDEPFTGLDRKSANEITVLLNKMKNIYTIVIIMHERNSNLNIDRVISINV